MKEHIGDAPEPFLAGTAPELPDSIRSEYQILSCLKSSDQSSAYLLRAYASGRKYLLKLSSDPIFAKTLFNEKEILERIHRQPSPLADTFPSPVSLELFQGTACYIRSYIEGQTLQELCESGYQKPGIPADRALDYLIHASELLHFLHTLTPPLIHRDIKPQNIVVGRDGRCHFIDLGISRFYEKAQSSDTVVMGTRLTAPPEQFGYQQTDTRSDLYSLGIVLLYCLTGEYEPVEKNLALLDPALKQIVRKATMFDPDRRYQTTSELLADLLKVRYVEILPPPAHIPAADGTGGIPERPAPSEEQCAQKYAHLAAPAFRGAAPGQAEQRTAMENGSIQDASVPTKKEARDPRLALSRRLNLLLAILCICLAAGLLLPGLRGRRENPGSSDDSPEAKAFGSAIQETGEIPGAKAKVSGETSPAAAQDTRETSELSAQDTPYTFQEPLIEAAVREALNCPEGAITEKDLARVTSLHLMGMQIYSDDEEFWFNSSTPYCYDEEMQESELYLQPGTVSSLEDITHMPNLVTLSLYRQQITDLSPLKDTGIKNLGIGMNPVTDLTPLAGDTAIKHLNLTGLETSDAATISTLTGLKELVLTETNFHTLKGLESCPLTDLTLCGLILEDYSELQSFPLLTSLTLNTINWGIAEDLAGMGLTKLVCFNASDLALEDLNGLPSLTSLYLNSVPGADYAVGEVQLPNLKELFLLTYTISDFSELAALPQLTTLHLYGADCQGYAGLDQIPKLTCLNVTEDQKHAIQEAYPESRFLFQF